VGDCFSSCDVGNPTVKDEEGCMRPVCKPEEHIISTGIEEDQRKIRKRKNTKSVSKGIEKFSMPIIESPVVVQSCKVTGRRRCDIDCKRTYDKD
jgi:hypothetical protein